MLNLRRATFKLTDQSEELKYLKLYQKSILEEGIHLNLTVPFEQITGGHVSEDQMEQLKLISPPSNDPQDDEDEIDDKAKKLKSKLKSSKGPKVSNANGELMVEKKSKKPEPGKGTNWTFLKIVCYSFLSLFSLLGVIFKKIYQGFKICQSFNFKHIIISLLAIDQYQTKISTKCFLSIRHRISPMCIVAKSSF